MANATATQLQQLYVAYFGRAADPSGLDYWVNTGTSSKVFAASMHEQGEFTSVYGSKTIEAQVNQIYQNLFARDAEADGLLYWTNQIRTGALELASIANDLIYAVNNGSSATDLEVLTNKTNAAVAYTDQVRLSTDTIVAYAAKTTSPFEAGDALTEGKSFISGITTTAHTTEAISESITALTAAPVVVAPTSYTLTSDTPSITEADSGSKDLTFTISLDTAAEKELTINYETLTTGTADAGDDFTSKAGTVVFAAGQKTATVSIATLGDTAVETDETVSIKFSGSDLAADVTVSGTISNNDVEAVATGFTLTTGVDEPSSTYTKFDASLTSSGTQTLGSLDKISGTTGSSDTLNATITKSVTPASLSGIEIVNIASETNASTLGLINAADLTKVNAGGSSSDLTLSGLGKATVISISDSQSAHTITFDDVSGDSDSAALTLAQVTGAATVTLGGVETLAITSSGGESSNSIDLTAGDLETATVTGSGDLTLAALDGGDGTEGLSKLDASVMTGALNVTTGGQVGIGNTDLTVLGGSGNDTLNVAGHTTSEISVDGGSGNDTITIVLAADDTVAGGDGTDTLSTSLNLSTAGNVTGIEKLTLTGAVTQDMDFLSDNTITTVGVSGAVAAGFSDASADVTNLDISATSTAAITFDRKTDTSTDSLTTTVKGATTLSLTASEEETLTIKSDTGASIITTLDAADLTSLTITGGSNLTVGTVSNALGFATLDASAAAGAISIGNTANASTTAMTVTAGSGALTVTTSTAADTVTGGIGADSITSGTGADSIVGAAGNDTIDAGAGNDIVTGGTGADSITTGAGDDNISGGAGNDSITIAANYDENDTIDGGEGTDTLALTGFAGTTTPSTLTSIETVEYTTAGAGANTLALVSASSVNKVTIIDAGADFDNTISGFAGGTVVFQETENDSLTVDTVDSASLTLEVKAVTDGGSTTITDATSVTLKGAINGGDLTALALDGVDTTSLTINTTDVYDIDTGVVTGTDKLQTLTLTTAAAGGNVITSTFDDASSLTSISATGIAGNITTGTIGSGGGTDVAESLATITATASAASDITFGVISGDTSTDSVTDNSMSITATVTSSTGADSSSVTFGHIDNEYGTVTLAASSDSVTSGTDVGGVHTGTITGTNVTLTNSGSAGGLTMGSVNASGTFSVTSTGSSATTITAGDAEGDTTIDAGESTGKLTVTAFSSTDNVTVTGGSGSDAITVAGVAETGKVHSLVGGAGNDTITGGTGAETIVGGTGNDSLVGSTGNDNISGGGGNDTFSFMTSGTLTSADTIDGGDGTDTLNITTGVDLADSATASTSVTATGIEIADIQFTASKTVDAANWDSLTTLTLGHGTNTGTATVNALPTGVTVTLDDANLDGVTLDTDAGASLTVDAEAAIATSLTIGDAVSVTINGEGTTADLTTLALDSTDTTSLTLTADGGTSLDTGAITGTDKLETLTVTTSVASGTITTGTGAIADLDSLTSLTATANAADLTLGALGSNATAGNAENLATINLTATGTGVNLKTGAIYADNTVDSSSDLDLTITATTNAGSEIDINHGGAAIVNTYGSITGNFTTNASNGGGVTTGLDVGNLTATAITLTIDGGGDSEFEDIVGSGAVSITGSGSGNIDINDINVDGSSASLAVNASAMTGTITADASNSSVVATMTGGSGDDTLTGGSKADTLSGGAGADTITTNNGNDTVAGGAGNDTITGGAGDNVITGGDGNDSITAGAGFDNINGGGGNDTIVMGSNVSLSDSVDGGDGTDTLTATIDGGTSNQKVGTVSNIEKLSLNFNQTAGSFDAESVSTAEFTIDQTSADSMDIDIDNLGSGSNVIFKPSASDHGADTINLDYANDATAIYTVNSNSVANDIDETLTFTDAQTITINAKGGAKHTQIGAITLDQTTSGAGGTDVFTLTADAASTEYEVTGAIAGSQVTDLTLTSTDGGIIDLNSTVLTAAAKLVNLTASAAGSSAANIDANAMALGDAGADADALKTITVTAADAGDVTLGTITGAAADVTSITVDATASGSVATFAAMTFDTVTTITSTAVSGATVDFAGVITASTIGTVSHSGAGAFNMDAANVITTLERLDLTGATGTNTVDFGPNTNATTFNTGAGTNVILLTGAGDDVNLASADGTDTLQYEEQTSQTAIASVSNFEFGSSGDVFRIEQGQFQTADAIITGTIDMVDGNAASLADAAQSFTINEITADETLAAGDDLLVFVGVTFASRTAFETAIETGDVEITTGSAFAHDDAILGFYSDGTNGYLAAIIAAAATPTAAIASGELDIKNLAIFEGVTSISSGDIVAGNFTLVT